MTTAPSRGAGNSQKNVLSQKSSSPAATSLAVIRLRGSVNLRRDIEESLAMLRLRRVNHCILAGDTPSMRGMLKKAGSWITWGEASPETEKLLRERRGPGPVFRLSPASHGLKSIKLPFPKGDLGYRGAAINDLLKRMV